MADNPYTRIYHKLADEYPEVYDDKATLGAYVQLLIAADQAWPSHARWQGYADEDEMARLEATGLVERDGKRYAIRGLDKDRKRRRRSARKGAAARWGGSDADADADALASLAAMQTHSERTPNGMPNRAKPNQTKPNQTKKNLTARVKTRGKTEPEQIASLLGGGT